MYGWRYGFRSCSEINLKIQIDRHQVAIGDGLLIYIRFLRVHRQVSCP